MNQKVDPENFYLILGVTPAATQEEIRRRYRQLVKELHPDCNQGRGDEEIRRINEAYEVLSRSRSRSRYDAILFNRLEKGVRSATFSSAFHYEGTRQAYEAYVERIKKRREKEDSNDR